MNVVRCVDLGIPIIALLGKDGGSLAQVIRLEEKIIVQSYDMQIIEDVHLITCHMIVRQIMEEKTSG